MQPQTRYARSGDVGIAYQVFGEGEIDLVVAFPFVSHLDLLWENPAQARFMRRLGSFARVILFDRRGVGLSDPVDSAATLEERMDDVRAVMDAADSERAALLGMSEGSTMCMLFAATYPERVSALILWGAMARSTAAPDYPWAPEKEAVEEAQLLREALLRLLYRDPPRAPTGAMGLREVLRLNRIMDELVTYASVGHTDALFFQFFEAQETPLENSPGDIVREAEAQLALVEQELSQIVEITPVEASSDNSDN